MISKELVESISFFDSFTREKIELILNLFEAVSYQPGETILQQGDFNIYIYFLLEGEIEIFVDNQFVVSLNKEGTVLGEMSIAGHTTCTATVKAKTQTSFLRISWDAILQRISPHYVDQVARSFYQSCSEILAEKLIKTNAIAKSFKEQIK